MRFLALFIVLFVGCATPFNSLEGRMPEKYYKHDHNKTVAAIKQTYFTDEAYQAIKDIPCVDGFTSGGSYVVGANFWGSLAGLFTGSGISRKCVMSPKSIQNKGPGAFVHEYVHHLDDMGRDGEYEFINLEEFADAYVKMAADTQWAGIVHYAEERSNSFVTDTFGLGPMSEHIAYVAEVLASGKGPDYMWHVFRKVLRDR